MSKPDEERVRELEQEVSKLRAELADVRTRYEIAQEILDTHLLKDIPRADEDVRRALLEGQSFGELLDELEREFHPRAGA